MDKNGDYIYVKNDDLITFENVRLPYLKSIDLVFYTPEQFGLTKWETHFVIPDYWMKRLYRNEMYKDTEVDDQTSGPEQITEAQKNLLKDYLWKHRQYEDVVAITRQNRPKDHLIEDLDKCPSRYDWFIPKILNNKEDETDQERDQSHSDNFDIKKIHNETIPLSQSKKNNITVCRKHRVQVEESIVEKAIDKMKQLPSHLESYYQELLKDDEFMEILNTKVESFLNKRFNSKSFSKEKLSKK